MRRPPVGAKLTDTFGAARSGGRKHEGIDIFAPEGTPIHAVAGGTIVQGFTNGLGGNVVRIQGDDGRFYYYAHLTPGSTDSLKVGSMSRPALSSAASGTPVMPPAPRTTCTSRCGRVASGSTRSTSSLRCPTSAGPPERRFRPGRDRSLRDRPRRAAVGDRRRRGRADRPVRAVVRHGPTKADTDGDGLSDAYETSVSHTDPLSIDTNHDGVTDAVEIARARPRARPDPGRRPRRRFRRTRDPGQRQRRRQ